MHRFWSSSLLLTIILASTSASPITKKSEPDAKAKVDLLPLPEARPKDFVAAKNKACLRYNMGCEKEVVSAVTLSSKVAVGGGKGSGEVTATPVVHDSQYLCPVSIGGQTLLLNLDTGSADLWVFNTNLSAENFVDRTVYDPAKSKTYKNIPGSQYSISYGDGSQSYGTVAAETVEVGGLQVVGQAVELPTAVSRSFTEDLDSEGIMGMAFKRANSIRPNSQPTFFENLMPQLQEPLFTANLKLATPGTYEFGVIDKSSFVGDTIHYTPVNSSGGFWQFATTPGSSPGIADTGTSLLLLDDDIVNTYWANVQGTSKISQGITFSCNTILPDFEIQLGVGYTATIAGSLINYAPVEQQPGICFGGIQSNNGAGVNIFGDIMFKSQFVVFDAGQMRIGFAPAA